MLPPVAKTSLTIGLIVYLLLLAVPVALKLLHLVAANWWLVTVFGWGPFVFTLAFVLVSLAWSLLKPTRRVL